MNRSKMQVNQYPTMTMSKTLSEKPKNGNYCAPSLLHFSLSSSHDLPYLHKRSSTEDLLNYIQNVLTQLYEEDHIGIKQTFNCFLSSKFTQLKSKIQQRLSLLNYLEESLKYKSFAQIEMEMLKEWKKNVLFFSISTIWSRCIINHSFNSEQEFTRQYENFRTFIANLTQFYFKNSLKLLNSKNIDTFQLILNDTSHQIINNLLDWKQIYQNIFLRLIHTFSLSREHSIDICKLNIDLHYINPQIEENQLQLTTRCIINFIEQQRIKQKIRILKEVRTTFFSEIQSCSNKSQKLMPESKKISQFQKDDILDCMIYCIVKGKIYNLRQSLTALSLLIGKNSDLLSRKGVDSYRADLEGAVEYLESYLKNQLI